MYFWPSNNFWIRFADGIIHPFNGPFNFRTHVLHLNTGLICYSDPDCNMFSHFWHCCALELKIWRTTKRDKRLEFLFEKDSVYGMKTNNLTYYFWCKQGNFLPLSKTCGFNIDVRNMPSSPVVSTIISSILFARFCIVDHVPTIQSFLCDVINCLETKNKRENTKLSLSTGTFLINNDVINRKLISLLIGSEHGWLYKNEQKER